MQHRFDFVERRGALELDSVVDAAIQQLLGARQLDHVDCTLVHAADAGRIGLSFGRDDDRNGVEATLVHHGMQKRIIVGDCDVGVDNRSRQSVEALVEHSECLVCICTGDKVVKSREIAAELV